MNGDSDELKNFYGYKETFGKHTTWVDIPHELTFLHTNNPYEDDEDGPGGTGLFEAGIADVKIEDHEPYYRPQHDEEPTRVRSMSHIRAFGAQTLNPVSGHSQTAYNGIAPPLSNQNAMSSPRQSAGAQQYSHPIHNRNLDYILNPLPTSPPPVTLNQTDPHLHARSPSTQTSIASPEAFHNLEHVRTSSSYGSSHVRPGFQAGEVPPRAVHRAALDDPELAFLLRDYSERVGYWMDIFDLSFFFSVTVPSLSVRCPLLLYSCVALSAKSLARVNGRKAVMGGQISPSRQSQMEKWPTAMNSEAWLHRARQYYDLAVSLIRQALAGATRPPTASLPEEASPATISNAQGSPLPTMDSDELVAAIAVLCVYEFFDVAPEWGPHLDGASSLLAIANDQIADMTRPASPAQAAGYEAEQITNLLTGKSRPRLGLAGAKRSVFWCYARQDMLSAFINHTVTRVDTLDIRPWRSAGLKFNVDGLVCPSNPLHPEYEPHRRMRDDMISNALIYLLAKLVNFIVAPEASNTDLSPPDLDARQREQSEAWDRLDIEFRAWHDGLTDNFNATAVSARASNLAIEEKWFPRSSCGSTMQWWHFGRIQLLHNKPQFQNRSASQFSFDHHASGMSLAQRHANYASILRQSREHAREIVSIGLGRADEGSRVHSVQPLWTAGLVLGTSEDRDVDAETNVWRHSVLSQLRGIEIDLGWRTDYRVRSLLEAWHLPPDWGLENSK